MQVFISRNGEQLGAWTEEEVRRYFQTGNLVATDHYWREGMAQWDTLGRLLAPPLPVVPARPMQPAVPPPARPSRRRSGRQRESPLAWIVPLVLAVVLACLIGPMEPEPTAPGHLGAIIGAVIVFVIAAFPISFAIPVVARLPVRCVIVLFCSALVFAGKQQMATRRFTNELKNFSEQQEQSDRDQIAKHGYVKVDGQKLDSEIQKLQDLSQGENGRDRIVSDATLDMLKNIASRSHACRDAEKQMLAMSMGPSRLTSLDEIDKRRAAVQAVLPTVQAMVDYLRTLDTTVHDDLVTKGIRVMDADQYVKGMDRTGKREVLLTYWQQEGAISQDMLANLDLLKKDWGHWRMDGEKVIFNDSGMLAQYRANIATLKSDIALQKTAQQRLLNQAAP